MDRAKALTLTAKGAYYGQALTALAGLDRNARPFPPEAFGYIVAKMLQSYTEEERHAWRAGFLSAWNPGAQS